MIGTVIGGIACSRFHSGKRRHAFLGRDLSVRGGE